MTKYIRKTRYTKKKSVNRCDAVTSKRCKSGRIVKTKISKRYNKMVKKGGDCRIRPAGSTPVTPGYEYLQELRGGPKDPNSVYMCIGHGCDIEGEVLEVPRNCNYITRTACGITANENQSLIFDFLNGNLNISDLKKYETYQFEEHSSDDALVHVVTYEFRNHTAGQQYVNNKNATFLRLGWPAGLRKFGNPHTTGELIDGQLKKEDMFKQRHSISQLNWYLLHFKESLFPTQEQVERCLKTKTEAEYYSYIKTNFDYSKTGFDGLNKKFTDMMRANFGIDYECIMDVFPGTHINYGCRGICGTNESDTEGTNEFVSQQRRLSGTTPLVVEKTFSESAYFSGDGKGTLSHDIKQLIEQNKK